MTDGLTKDWRTDGQTDWQTDGLTVWQTDWLTNGQTDWQTDGRRDQYLSEYVWRCKKKDTNKFGEHYRSWKNAVAQLRRVGLNFQYQIINRGEILNKMAMLEYFINRDAFLNKMSMLEYFINRDAILNKMAMLEYFINRVQFWTKNYNV